MKPILVISEPNGFPSRAATLLARDLRLKFGPFSRRALCREVEAATGLMVRLGHRIDCEVLAGARCLRFIASPTTALNHIDLSAAAAANVEVLSLKGERAFLDGVHATAEHSWGLLLALLRRIPAAHASVLEGGWDRDSFRGGELHGKTLGIVGFGRLGSKVANYGRAFGMRVIANDSRESVPSWVEASDLVGLVARCDVLSIHVSFGPQTRNLINAAVLAHAKPGCLVVNTARGEVVDEAALLAGLISGRIGGAALDVLCFENTGGKAREDARALIDYGKTHSNLVVTPHIGGATVESMEKTEIFVAERIHAFVRSAWTA